MTSSIRASLLPGLDPVRGPEAAATDGRKLRVLIVDDHEDYSAGLCAVIRSWGYPVEAARSGEQALRCAAEFQPRVVFLDLGLPDLHGHALATQLREVIRDPRVHFIVITGFGQPADYEGSAALGIAHHLVKPVDTGLVRELLAAYQSADEAHTGRTA
jgi:CheY-like chemotaxis protein